MPTYEYACPDCGHKFEQFQSIKADPLTDCPECDGKNVKRLISSGGGLIFKGTGFYATDYRSDGYKSAASSDKKNGTSSTTKKTESTTVKSD
jgi:putative FmdB family regulatory protein